uniref:Uncharacterized protein n=1 Tax=uncultured bacterium A1Q1_fos_2116 TaxID=1256564 RepID=L7VW66_9BACT|nr:hypothetical protein [uncultured bacterium A1Q1_fos_2116]
MDAKESSLIAADTVSSALPVARISQTTQNPKINDSVFHWNLGVFLVVGDTGFEPVTSSV